MLSSWLSAVPKSLLGSGGQLPFSHQSAFGLEHSQKDILLRAEVDSVKKYTIPPKAYEMALTH